MSEHYYTDKPTVESNEHTFPFELRGKRFMFTSDSGVFSKKEIDFGSKLLIEKFTFPEREGDILDVGCGYGPIGISLANEDKERTVWMIDVNERALQLSKKNASANQVTNIVIEKSDLLSNITKNDFTSIVTNPPIRAGKQVVHELYEQAYEHLKIEGELWVVIQKKQGAPSTIEKLETMFQEVEVVEKKKGYFIIKAKKY
ncbi:class I SAM-dependent methyltransferase [Bacillus sp. FJAT-45350]|uniref:class I SAM-dependent methyltransferase n=1 Tax=Bacillus sp. FJAT-45350 TaxID=2011014 RepID=UPI000BB9B869|nr:class I SAM-dependent methyltransferase [Bacillus sp. FJAT-45350]